MGSWPFPAPLLDLDDDDFMLARLALSEASRMDLDTRRHAAEHGALKTIEFLAEAMK